MAVLSLLWWTRCGLVGCRAWSTQVIARYYHGKNTLALAASLHDHPSLWKGASHSSSAFVTHVVATTDEPTVEQAIGKVLQNRTSSGNVSIKMDDLPPSTEEVSPSNGRQIPLDNARVTPRQLLRLGAVWFLPAEAPRDPSRGGKPTRLSETNATQILNEGDYLRVHHSPRRFPQVYKYNWTAWHPTLIKTMKQPSNIVQLPGVVVARNDATGFLVIEKPAHVPVHATVDNALENVATMLCMELQSEQEDDNEECPYVATPQRLDQNTSGLLVVATQKKFASYFAKLLRHKTDQQLSSSAAKWQQRAEAVHKTYKCLVCLMQTSSHTSVLDAYQHLQVYAKGGSVLRHYLEPSIRAPKHFAAVPENDTWAECLLRILQVGEICPLVGNQASRHLVLDLWQDADSMPQGCTAVVEMEVELLTGRTHQIRGQLAAEGYPLVGDAQYGGAVPAFVRDESSYIDSERLALHCCELEFLDPDFIQKKDGEVSAVPSERWNRYRLDTSWWSASLRRYLDSSPLSSVATSGMDQELVQQLQRSRDTVKVKKNDDTLLPPTVQLAPGVHKYVLVKATHPSDSEELWFVKSATPKEAGGPYHANVAEGLVEWLQAAGYETLITGGGRIEYDEKIGAAVVYGFSYGFGKGDHALAASIISNWSEGRIMATYNDSDGLY